MTEARKLKQAIRARARKTGEGYTAARRHVLLARGKRRLSAPPSAAPSAAPAPPPRSRAGISDAAVTKKTGHGLDHWFAILDRFEARAKGHTASARHLYDAHGVEGWYAQMITVAYERARGLRAANQAGGAFQVSVSKTLPVDVGAVARALSEPRRRALWLAGVDPALSRALEAAFTGAKPRQVVVKEDDYARLRYPWNGAAVEIRVYGKPGGKASIVADNKGLADAAAVERRRTQWRAALTLLAKHLTG
jgi:hypothetical protein